VVFLFAYRKKKLW